MPFVKIKIFHVHTDDLIAIRVPPNISLETLVNKVRERLGEEVTTVRYREELGAVTSSAEAADMVVLKGGARLIALPDDARLERWLRNNTKPILYADSTARN